MQRFDGRDGRSSRRMGSSIGPIGRWAGSASAHLCWPALRRSDGDAERSMARVRALS